MPDQGKRPDMRQVLPLSLIATLGRTMRQFGGLRHVARRAWGMLRREGWKGVARGFVALRAVARRQSDDGRNDYERWIIRYDALTDAQRKDLRARVVRMRIRPLVSVIMPVYNPELRWLQAAIESVREQIYPNWELCIADDASSDPAIRPLLSRYAAMDERIKVEFRHRNGHISASSNTALALARGEWVVLFDHDDLLAEHALFWVVDAVERNADAALVYSDEDKITESGMRCVPHFKPDWNYDLFLSYNMICHLGAYRRDLIDSVGGFRQGMEGAQDYDLALRCVERIAPSQIVHVPRVLYHWRMHPASTALGPQSKPYALPAGELALNEHFVRQGIAASAQVQSAGYYKISYALPDPLPHVSLVVSVQRADGDFFSWLTRLVHGTSYASYEILITTNDPGIVSVIEQGRVLSDVAHERRSTLPHISVVRHEASSHSLAGVDRAVDASQADFVAVMEQGLEPLSPDWLSDLTAQAARSGVAAVAPRIVDPGGNVARAGVIFGINSGIGWPHRGCRRGDGGYFQRALLTQSLAALTPGCLIVRKTEYQKAGGLCVSGLPRQMAEADLCLRLRDAGLRNLYIGEVALQARLDRADSDWSRPPEGLPAALSLCSAQVRRRWEVVLRADPAYNPNLTLEDEDFSLAWPPRVGRTQKRNPMALTAYQ